MPHTTRRTTADAVLLCLGAVAGVAIGYMDSRPTWDDTGITAAAIFIVCGILGAVSPGRAWVWALVFGHAAVFGLGAA